MNIIMIPFHDYKKWINEGFRTRDAHLYEHFSKSNSVDKILVINRPTSMAEYVLKHKGWKVSQGQIEYSRNFVQLNKMSEKTWCLDILMPDFLKVAFERKMWWFSAFKSRRVINQINKCIDYLGFHDSILLLQNPMAIGAAQNIHSSKFVFDAIDNWLFHPQMPNKELIARNYKYVDEHADLILTVSEELKKTFPNNGNIQWVPNGVDCDFFSPAIKAGEASKSTVVGYVGKIQDRVDFDLVEECLRNTNYQYVFIGPVFSQNERIKELKKKYTNIRFVGDVHYNDLPKFMKSFDIAIIPHKVDDFTNSMNPLKLYEYLASGKPVVTTSVAGTASVSEFVYVADSNEKFVGLISELGHNRNFEAKEIVASVPDDCKWESRTARIIELLEE